MAPADLMFTFPAEFASVIVMSVPSRALSLFSVSVPVALVALVTLMVPTFVTSMLPFKVLKSRRITFPLLVISRFLSAEAAVISALLVLLIIMSWVAVEELSVTLLPPASIVKSFDEPVVVKVVSAEIIKLMSLSVWLASFIVEKCEPTDIGKPTFIKSSVFIRELELEFSKLSVLLPEIFAKFTSNS